MSKLALAVLAGALAILATPASAQHHNSRGHRHVQAFSSHQLSHVQHQAHLGHHKVSHAHVHHIRPVYYAPVHHVHVKPVHVVYTAPSHCFHVIKTNAYGHYFRTVECKVIEHAKPVVKVAEVAPAPVPAPAPAQVVEEAVPQK